MVQYKSSTGNCVEQVGHADVTRIQSEPIPGVVQHACELINDVHQCCAHDPSSIVTSTDE